MLCACRYVFHRRTAQLLLDGVEHRMATDAKHGITNLALAVGVGVTRAKKDATDGPLFEHHFKAVFEVASVLDNAEVVFLVALSHKVLDLGELVGRKEEEDVDAAEAIAWLPGELLLLAPLANASQQQVEQYRAVLAPIEAEREAFGPAPFWWCNIDPQGYVLCGVGANRPDPWGKPDIVSATRTRLLSRTPGTSNCPQFPIQRYQLAAGVTCRQCL